MGERENGVRIISGKEDWIMRLMKGLYEMKQASHI
jgi:hypothetical protein